MSDRRGGGRPPRRPFEGRGEGPGGPPRGRGRDEGPPRREGGRPRDDDGPPRGRYGDDRPPFRGGPRDDRPPSRGRYGDDRPPARERYRDDAPPPRGRYGDDRPPVRDRYRDEAPPRPRYQDEAPPPRIEREEGAPPPWQREQRPPRPGPRAEVAGPPMEAPPEIPAEELQKAYEKVAAACIEVARQLGNALEPTVYHRALALELQARGIAFQREARIPIGYRGRQIDTRKVDYLVEGCIVEIVSQPKLTNEEVVRATNYLKASGYPTAVLVNFGTKKPDVRRLGGEAEEANKEET